MFKSLSCSFNLNRNGIADCAQRPGSSVWSVGRTRRCFVSWYVCVCLLPLLLCEGDNYIAISATERTRKLRKSRFSNYLIADIWQFNSRNGDVKAKFTYLCTSGCCRLRNALLVKLRSSWDDGSTVWNSLQNRFSVYLTVTSTCVGCQECQQVSKSVFLQSIFFFILERAKNHTGLSQMKKVDGPFS
jgi:hypothetical protein